MSKNAKPKLRPYYRLTELMDLTEGSRKQLMTLLRHGGIKVRRSGRLCLVFAADIEARMPELWRSLVLCERARALARTVADAEDVMG